MEANPNVDAADEVAELTDAEVFVIDSDLDWMPVPLSPGRSIKLARLVGEILTASIDQLSALAGKNDLSNADIISLLDVLTEDQLVRLLALVTNKDSQWVVTNFSLLNAVGCLGAFWQSENLGKVGAAVQYVSTVKPRSKFQMNGRLVG